jgi:hypothetical protein
VPEVLKPSQSIGQLDPARRLAFSPPWPDEAVVFDACSGDFWIVVPKVRDLLEAAAILSPENAASLLKQFPSQVLFTLIEHGIIRSSTTN